ncbi:CAL-2 protein, partial [Aphelenchoides avenae]
MGVHKRQNAGNVYKRAVAVSNSWLSKGESVLVTIWKGHGEAPTFDISEEEMVGFRQAFAMLDSDSSGSISSDELGIAMRLLGQNPTEQELLDMTKEIDLDGDGTIDFKEFCQFMKRINMESDREMLREAFRVFDHNGDGYIAANELRSFVTNIGNPLSEQEVEFIIAQ